MVTVHRKRNFFKPQNLLNHAFPKVQHISKYHFSWWIYLVFFYSSESSQGKFKEEATRRRESEKRETKRGLFIFMHHTSRISKMENSEYYACNALQWNQYHETRVHVSGISDQSGARIVIIEPQDLLAEFVVYNVHVGINTFQCCSTTLAQCTSRVKSGTRETEDSLAH